MKQTKAGERIVVPIVRAEATANWLFLQQKKGQRWFLPIETKVKKAAILIAVELLVKHIRDIDNIQPFYTITSDGRKIQMFVSCVDFETTFELHKSITNQMWANPVEVLNMPQKSVDDFTRYVLEVTLRTAQKLHNK